MSVSRPLTESQIAELRRQLAILESKAAQATEPVVRNALASKIAQIKGDLGETAPVEVAPTPAEPTPAAQPTEYHVFINGAAQGPVDATTIHAMLAAGQIDRATKVWVQGLPEWGVLADFPELAAAPEPEPIPADSPAPAATPAANETSTPKKKRWEDDVVLPAPASPEQIRQADEWIRQARIAKMRGGAQEYSRLLNQALQAAPGAPNVLEAVGDDLMEQNNPGEARLAYYKAHKMAPKNVQIERKYAEVVFKSSANRSWETQMMLETEAVANAKYAALLSAIVPGVGQIVLQERVKGGIMATIWFFSLIGIILFRNDVQQIIRLAAGQHTHASWIVLFIILVFILNWLAAVMDCMNKTKGKGETAGLMAFMSDEKTTVQRDKKERPIPPANLPFE